MRFLTDRQVSDIPALGGLGDEDRTRVLDDAERLYRYVARNPWISYEDLILWAQRKDLDAMRTNAAVALLRETNRLLGFGADDAGSDVLSPVLPSAGTPDGSDG